MNKFSWKITSIKMLFQYFQNDTFLMTNIEHCDKSICRPGNIPCNSWEHINIIIIL